MLVKVAYVEALNGEAIVPPVVLALTFIANTPLIGIVGEGVVEPV